MPTDSNQSPKAEVNVNYFQRTIAALHRIEDAMLVLVLGSMVVLATLQIFLRNFFDSGIYWVDPLLRSLVLWIGLLGALVAARTDKHISIDVLSRILPPRIKGLVDGLTKLFVGVVAFIIAWHSLRLVHSDYQEGSIAFAVIPAWIIELIIPLAFCVIALRYTIYAVVQWRSVWLSTRI